MKTDSGGCTKNGSQRVLPRRHHTTETHEVLFNFKNLINLDLLSSRSLTETQLCCPTRDLFENLLSLSTFLSTDEHKFAQIIQNYLSMFYNFHRYEPLFIYDED